MRIGSVKRNNRRRTFEVRTSMKTLVFPFAKAEPAPTAADPITEIVVDPEAGREAFTYTLQSGRNGTVHVERYSNTTRIQHTCEIFCSTG